MCLFSKWVHVKNRSKFKLSKLSSYRLAGRISKLPQTEGFLNVDLGMANGSVTQRFPVSQISKNYKTEAGEARDAKKYGLAAAALDSR